MFHHTLVPNSILRASIERGKLMSGAKNALPLAALPVDTAHAMGNTGRTVTGPDRLS